VKKEKIWIYDTERKRFRQLDKNDPRLGYGGGRTGVVELTHKNGETTLYCYGATPEEAADHENSWVYAQMKPLYDQIERLKLRLVKP
jgi:hypothetical protein